MFAVALAASGGRVQYLAQLAKVEFLESFHRFCLLIYGCKYTQKNWKTDNIPLRNVHSFFANLYEKDIYSSKKIAGV